MKSSKFKNMSNGKKKGKQKTSAASGNLGGDGQFHYFSLSATKNEDGTVLLVVGELNPLPEGWILKDISINKHDQSWDEGAGGAGGNSSSSYLGSPWGLGPSQSEDIRTWPDYATRTAGWIDVGNPAGAPGIKYNVVGSAGIPNDVSSGDPVGSEVVLVTF